MDWHEANDNEGNQLAAVIIPTNRPADIYPLDPKVAISSLPILNRSLIEYQIHYLAFYDVTKIVIITQKTNYEWFNRVIEKMHHPKLFFKIVTFDDVDEPSFCEMLSIARLYLKKDFILMSNDLITNVNLHNLIDLHFTTDSLLTSVFVPIKENSPKQEPNKIFSAVGVSCDESGHVLFYVKSDKKLKSLNVPRDLIRSHRKMKIMTDKKKVPLYFVSADFFEVLDMLKAKKPQKSVDLKSDETGNEIDEIDEVENFLNLALDWGSENYKGKKIHMFCDSDADTCTQMTSIDAFKTLNFEFLNRAIGKSKSVWGALLEDLTDSKDVQARNKTSKIGRATIFGASVKMGEKSIFKKSIIGDHCTIGDKVKVVNSIIFDHATVANGATISDSVVFSNATLEADCSLEGCVVSDSAVVFEKQKLKKKIV